MESNINNLSLETRKKNRNGFYYDYADLENRIVNKMMENLENFKKIERFEIVLSKDHYYHVFPSLQNPSIDFTYIGNYRHNRCELRSYVTENSRKVDRFAIFNLF